MEGTEEKNHHIIRQDDKEIRSIRLHGKTQQTPTVTFMHPLTYGSRQRDLVLFTNRTLITVN